MAEILITHEFYQFGPKLKSGTLVSVFLLVPPSFKGLTRGLFMKQDG